MEKYTPEKVVVAPDMDITCLLYTSEIVDKYDNPLSQYLLPIIKPLSEIDERKQYIYTAHNRCV